MSELLRSAVGLTPLWIAIFGVRRFVAALFTRNKAASNRRTPKWAGLRDYLPLI